MADKKQPVKKVMPKKVAESKKDRFNRIAKRRMVSILKQIDLLGNCGNRANYDYTESQVHQIITTLEKAIGLLTTKFEKSKESIAQFEFNP